MNKPVAWRMTKEGQLNCTVYDEDYYIDLQSNGWKVIDKLYSHPTPSQPSPEALVRAALEAAGKTAATANSGLTHGEIAEEIYLLDIEQIIKEAT